MELVTIVGAVAGVASTTSFLPQLVKVLRTRDTSSISAGMYVVTVTAFALWVTYGVMLNEMPLILSNGLSLLMSGFILVMKLLSKPGKEKVADTLEPVVGREEKA
jgi:MtN3 and saliva related transmembrane protein